MRVNKAKWALIGVAASALALGGCTKKVGGQVVAVVNGQEITQGELNAELGNQQIPPGADKTKVMAQLLQQVVNRKLLVGRAKDQGLDKSPAYLAQLQRGQDQLLIQMLASNAAKQVSVPDAAAADKFMAENPSLFAGRKRYSLDQVVFPAKPDAALAAKLKAAKTMPEVEAALTSSGIAFQRGTSQLDTAQIPPAIAAKIAALPAGEPFLVPQGGQVVVNVIRSAEPVPVPADQARPAATELLRRQAVEQAMKKQVDQARASAKITYAPGFAPPKPDAAAGAGAAAS
jgi:peptidyl-prolyl cis-trans isomerase C